MMVMVIEKARKDFFVPTEVTPLSPLRIAAMVSKKIRSGGQTRRMTTFRDTDGAFWVEDSWLRQAQA